LLVLFNLPGIRSGFLSFLKLAPYALEFKLLSLIIFFAVLVRIFVSYLTAEKRLELRSVIDFLRQSLWVFVLLLFFLVFNGFNLLDVMVILLLGFVVISAICLFFLRKELIGGPKSGNFDFSILKRGLMFGLPLIPVTLSSWAIEIGDRYILGFYQNLEAVAVYTLAYSLVTLIVNISATISKLLYPYIAEAWHKKEDYIFLFNASLKYSLMIVVPSMFGLFFLKGQIISLISGESYLKAVPLISILVIYPLFSLLIYLFYQSLLLSDKTFSLGGIYIFGAVANIFMNIKLIPMYGVFGAAFSTIISYAIMFLVLYFRSKKAFKWDYRFLKIPQIIFASLIMGVVVYIINPQIFVTKIATILFGVLFYFVLLFLFKTFVKEEIILLKNVFMDIKGFFKAINKL